MGLLEFSKLPVNTLVGADWKTFKEMTRGQEIAPDKRTKYYLTKSVCRLLSLLAPIQDRRFEEKLGAYEFDHDPVFILGHWRSGTTFVHNIFAQDDNFCYTTTYQTVFPPSDDVRATFLQEDDGLAYAEQTSDGQYGVGSRPAAGGRIRIVEHDALFLL